MKNFTNNTLRLALLMVAVFGMSAFTNASDSCEYNQTLKVEEFAVGSMLTWSTKLEVNVKLFVVEKSYDGVNFEEIGEIEAKGTASLGKDYSYLDINAQAGVMHYRLKKIFFSGQTKMTDPVIFDKLSKNDFTVISISEPKMDGEMEVILKAQSTTQLEYSVENSKGEKVYQSKQSLNKGINLVTINVADIDKMETYKILLEGNEEKEELVFLMEKEITSNISKN